MTTFAILLGGRVHPTPELRAILGGARVIAADSGMRHAAPLGLHPELWIGDFDSSPAPFGPGPAMERRPYPADKDQTDGELAIEAALDRGASRLILVGALGGARSDHAFSNLVLMCRYGARGLEISAEDGAEYALPLRPGTTGLALPPGTPFSILRFGDVAGLAIRGARWPLKATDLPFHSILTQSNEAKGGIEIDLAAGEAVLIARRGTEPVAQ